jgi:endonuclease/exonuclease/phosphatase family metal-dependent hydrolase
MLNLATFNIFWYPRHYVAQNQRDEEDDQRIARVLANLAPQVMVFQEIVNLERLQQVLAQAGTNLRLTSPEGEWLASQSGGSLKIACGYDPDVLELVAHGMLEDLDPDRRFDWRRFPYDLHLRHPDTGWEFTMVGVHLKSLVPWATMQDDLRRKEVEHLAEWLTAEPGPESAHFDAPPTPDVLVMGDFNLTAENPILGDLRSGTWHWPDPVVVTSLDEGEPAPTLEASDQRWTTFYDGVVIDHAFTTAGVAARLVDDPLIYAFDQDPALDKDPSPEGHWLRRKEAYWAKPIGGESYQIVANLYRISDHRPLRVTLDPG